MQIPAGRAKASMQRSGKGKFVDVWVELVGGDLCVFDYNCDTTRLARLPLGGSTVRVPPRTLVLCFFYARNFALCFVTLHS